MKLLEGVLTDGREDEGKPDGVALDELSPQQRDFVDLNNEVAGRDTGRMRRFVADARHDALTAQERKKDRELTALLLRLQDPNYARLYYRTEQVIDRAGEALSAAYAQNAGDADESREHLKEMEASAATLPDGRKVFRAADGRVYADDGEDVTAKAQHVAWPNGAATWEEYSAEQARLRALAGDRLRLDGYRDNVLNPAKERMRDEDNPPSASELETMLHDVDSKLSDALRTYNQTERGAAAKTSAQSMSADDFLDAPALNAPDLSAKFSTAHDGPASKPEAAQQVFTTPKATS